MKLTLHLRATSLTRSPELDLLWHHPHPRHYSQGKDVAPKDPQPRQSGSGRPEGKRLP